MILKEEQTGMLALTQHGGKHSRLPSTDIPVSQGPPLPQHTLSGAEGLQGTAVSPPLEGTALLTEASSAVSAVPV